MYKINEKIELEHQRWPAYVNGLANLKATKWARSAMWLVNIERQRIENFDENNLAKQLEFQWRVSSWNRIDMAQLIVGNRVNRVCGLLAIPGVQGFLSGLCS